jgi:8-amino-7-oxononanoate synthase
LDCTGNGLIAELKLQKHVDILITTLGKSLASQGAVMLFHNPKIRTYLINRVPEFVYSTYVPPATAATALMAIEVIQTEVACSLPPLRTNAANLRTTLRSFFPDLKTYDSPIIPLILKDPELTVQIAQRLAQQQIYVGAIRPPSVPKGTSRLRLSLHARVNFEKLIQLLTDFFNAGNIHQ